MRDESDFLVLGSGMAGLSFALKAAERGTVTLVTKRKAEDSNTSWAQGGIAGVLSPEDSFESHVRDTIEAGAGLCDPEVVERIVRGAPDRIRELIALGVRFTRVEPDRRVEDFSPSPNLNEVYHLTREGGHSTRRIIHADDVTGQEVTRALLEAARKHPNLRILEDTMAIDLLTQAKFVGWDGDRCLGAYVLERETGRIRTLLARATLLATGGAGKVYLYTTNPDTATGDGIAIAYRAGVPIVNMEFMQFHPTCLFHPLAKNFLISEAVRGEGAILRTRSGAPFMARYHPLEDLAPRDVVARAIDHELKESGEDCVFLDAVHLGPDTIRARFPNIYARCLSFGIDMTREPIPVVPAAHYTCGGVESDRDGRTALKGLYAAGETAWTGLHGANRLASNSLLEASVMADRAARAAAEQVAADRFQFPDVPPWDIGGAVKPDELVMVSHNWDEIRRLMWNYVGIVRTDRRLERALRRLDLLKREIDQYYWDFVVTPDLLELRNLAVVADLIVRSAAARKESRGLHYTLDYPGVLPAPRNTVLRAPPRTLRGGNPSALPV